mmetsp:Transcript_13205/g.15110  ORF Transcript_13205/g.15110 Transcript_13205/m.15110 type:complete len:90 (+) Transcript_13205:259-528(+)|eukprot:CAMPEP_0184039794 /NCGR_PEP_ID=MMETSP0955-20130417/54668_1 /TAXON_ID=627963 /ORGANISM="Aplanochytrium sp, Strain PBS07" /LENGTH=89 /DNA_ID=CAMNT_0026329207 /DNA_START=203 /DNA_END=472 /DNA_ORIENTATION=-
MANPSAECQALVQSLPQPSALGTALNQVITNLEKLEKEVSRLNHNCVAVETYQTHMKQIVSVWKGWLSKSTYKGFKESNWEEEDELLTV